MNNEDVMDANLTRIAELERENAELRMELTESEEGREAALNLWRMAIHGVTNLADLPSSLRTEARP